MEKTLKQIFKEDQQDRRSGIDWKIISQNDKQRRKEIKNILTSGKKLSAEELYHAAIIYHHSGNKTGTRKALELAKSSMCSKQQGKKATRWTEKAKWLIAATTDRLLILEGKLQKYGTQYQQKNARASLQLARYDKRTTDAERRKFNVPPLKQILKEIERLNKSI